MFLCSVASVLGDEGATTSGSLTSSADAFAASVNYAETGVCESIVGTSSPTAISATVKHGYVGQLSQVSGLLINAPETTIREGAEYSLEAKQVLDDDTLVRLRSESVVWSIKEGPLILINGEGKVKAGQVYQNTDATISGGFEGKYGLASLTVLNEDPDNFGLYANDGLPDVWQMQYFGPENSKAAPDIDASGNGETNLFKYVAGLDPLDPNDRFQIRIEAVPGRALQKRIIFAPRFPDRIYTVQFRDDLSSGAWKELVSGTTSDSGNERSVTDSDAEGNVRFYRVLINKP